MGTSQSKPDGPPNSLLIPPWAEQEPPPPWARPAEENDDQQSTSQVATSPELARAEPRRYADFRTELGRYAQSGSRNAARSALGHWARISVGGASFGARRLTRAARTSGAAISALASISAGQAPPPGSLDVRSLAGLPTDLAVDRIVDAFCPSGIPDQDLIRIAMTEALVVALADNDNFDPASIDGDAIRVITLTLVAELVFLSVAGDAGNALDASPSPIAAVQRETDLRSLIREVTDVEGTPILNSVGNVLPPDAVASLVSRLIETVETEMATW
jgi:hypothetical protein